MICITIAQESRHLLLADMLNAAAMGADLVEVRLDCLDNAPNFSDMLSAKRLPILFSCRRQQDGGNWQGTEEERLVLLRQAIMSKADYVEIEYDVADQIRPFPGCKRVISYTNTGKMPSAIGEIYEDMLTLKPDIVKLTVRARTPEEAWPLVQILGKPKAPTVVVGLGRPGLMLAVLGKKIGAPWTVAALERGMEAFPGQPTIRDLVDVYLYRNIGKPTRFVGVAGLGEREFLAGGLMNAAFVQLDLPHRVLPMPVGDLKLFRKVIDMFRLQGVSIEEDYFEHLKETAALDDSAKAPVLAGDLMLPGGEQGWIASNSLGSWAVAALENSLRERDPDMAEPLQGRTIMLGGSGPLTRMIAPALKQKGADILFASKDRAVALSMSKTFGGRQVPAHAMPGPHFWESIFATPHDVLIVSRDHSPRTEEVENEDELPIHPGCLKSNMTVLDLTTFPRRSPFLKEAKLRGSYTVAPANVLIEQVREHVKRIGGKEIAADFLREKLATWLDEEDS
jgi:3-dehydroquinate dehydratase/shikimate dehydrogenase